MQLGHPHDSLFIEYFVQSSEVKMFDAVLDNPISPVDGYITPRTEPGFGLHFNPDKINQFRI